MKKLLLLLTCSLLLFTGCREKKVEDKKMCCLQYGGKWENNDCADTGVSGVEFDLSGYRNCVNASSVQEEKKETNNKNRKMCCLQYGGKWENNDCADTGVSGVEFDSFGYRNCVNASSK